MSDLYRLVYASKNLLQGTEAEVTAAVRQILDASQRNNSTCLLYTSPSPRDRG